MIFSIAEAILILHPSAQFVITNNDYSTIRWDSTDIKQPTPDTLKTLMSSYQKPESLEQRITNLEAKMSVITPELK